MILKHVLDTQIFKRQKTKSVYQFPAFLMSKIPASVGDPLMNMLNGPAALGSFGCSLLSLREFTLGFRKALFISVEKARILNTLAIGEFRKARQPHIDSDGQITERQRLRLHLAGEAGIPVANRIPLEGEGLDLSFNWAMQNNLHRPDLGKEHTILEKVKAKLLECETIVPALSPKAGIACFFSSLHSAKECLESQIDTLLNVLQDLRIHLS